MIKDKVKRVEHRENVVNHLIQACCTKSDKDLLASIEEVRLLLVDYELAIDQLEEKLQNQ